MWTVVRVSGAVTYLKVGQSNSNQGVRVLYKKKKKKKGVVILTKYTITTIQEVIFIWSKKKKPIQEVSSGKYWPDISHIDLGVKCLAQIFLYFEVSRLHVTKVKWVPYFKKVEHLNMFFLLFFLGIEGNNCSCHTLIHFYSLRILYLPFSSRVFLVFFFNS